MMVSWNRRIVAALFVLGLAAPAWADTHHNGNHNGPGVHRNGNARGHYAGSGYRHGYYGGGPYYGGPYYGGPYYGGGGYAPGCLPVLGLVSGNFCGY